MASMAQIEGMTRSETVEFFGTPEMDLSAAGLQVIKDQRYTGKQLLSLRKRKKLYAKFGSERHLDAGLTAGDIEVVRDVLNAAIRQAKADETALDADQPLLDTASTSAGGGTSSSGALTGRSTDTRTHSSALGHDATDKHMLKQMEEREVEKRNIASALNRGVWYNSGQRTDRYVVMDYKQMLVVVITKNLSKDITVINSFGDGQPRWTKQGEVAQYLERGKSRAGPYVGSFVDDEEVKQIKLELKAIQSLKAAIYNVVNTSPDGVDLGCLVPLMKEYSVEYKQVWPGKQLQEIVKLYFNKICRVEPQEGGHVHVLPQLVMAGSSVLVDEPALLSKGSRVTIVGLTSEMNNKPGTVEESQPGLQLCGSYAIRIDGQTTTLDLELANLLPVVDADTDADMPSMTDEETRPVPEPVVPASVRARGKAYKPSTKKAKPRSARTGGGSARTSPTMSSQFGGEVAQAPDPSDENEEETINTPDVPFCEAKVKIGFGDFGAMMAFEQLELMSTLAAIKRQNTAGRVWIECNHAGSDAFILTRADDPVSAASQKNDIQKKMKLLKEGKRVVRGLKPGMDRYIKTELKKNHPAAAVDDLLRVAKHECIPPIGVFGDTATKTVVLFSSGTIRDQDYKKIKARLLAIEAER